MNLSHGIARVAVQFGALPLRLKLWLAWPLAATLLLPVAFASNSFFRAMLVCGQATSCSAGT